MRTIIQRVSQAQISINEQIYSSIEKGLLILLAVEMSDTQEDIDWLAGKIARLRIFDDACGVMNLSVKDINANCMVISQFTLFASTKKGNRPSYIKAAIPAVAQPLYEQFVQTLQKELRQPIATGVFGANMQINLTNDGPVTIIIDSKNKE
ncbi:MAG: D-tyrosyl-tRNA(Tyr) deacylase [Bacteroidales bacterium]|jgi:D-tyrosyl-tRNA(Tyr) deacylase|nr:D-tyrosyl-tRNA(Tyr) deacylase [Bacteroidales bacterium]